MAELKVKKTTVFIVIKDTRGMYTLVRDHVESITVDTVTQVVNAIDKELRKDDAK